MHVGGVRPFVIWRVVNGSTEYHAARDRVVKYGYTGARQKARELNGNLT